LCDFHISLSLSPAPELSLGVGATHGAPADAADADEFDRRVAVIPFGEGLNELGPPKPEALR
jgi:hypothetical protein